MHYQTSVLITFSLNLSYANGKRSVNISCCFYTLSLLWTYCSNKYICIKYNVIATWNVLHYALLKVIIKWNCDRNVSAEHCCLPFFVLCYFILNIWFTKHMKVFPWKDFSRGFISFMVSKRQLFTPNKQGRNFVIKSPVIVMVLKTVFSFYSEWSLFQIRCKGHFPKGRYSEPIIVTITPNQAFFKQYGSSE